MPRIFTERDREEIRQTLIGAGKEHFLRYGLRKTNVEELAKAAGIAKGTFYNFFESKEDLCLTIYDLEEEAMRRETASILQTHRDPAATVQALMAYSLRVIHGDSLLTRLRETGEYPLLARGVGRERLSEHLAHDVDFARELIEDLRSKGAQCNIEPEVAAGVLRAFVMMTFHENEIGSEIFPTVLNLMARWIATGITKGGESHG